jgi:hypothetical protein
LVQQKGNFFGSGYLPEADNLFLKPSIQFPVRRELNRFFKREQTVLNIVCFLKSSFPIVITS